MYMLSQPQNATPALYKSLQAGDHEEGGVTAK